MMLRLSLLLFCWSSAVVALQAQITYTASSFPAAGDVLPVATAVDSTLTITAASSIATNWDFSGLQATSTREDTIQAATTGANFNLFPTSDILGPLVGGLGTAYTDVTATQIVNVGGGVEVFGLSFAAPYTNPHVRQVVPLNYGANDTDQYALRYSEHVDSIPFLRQLIDSLTAGSPVPVNPDSIRVTLSGDEARLVDAWGTCMLPDSAVYDVLRQKVTTDFEISIEIGTPSFFGFIWVNLSNFIQLPFPTTGRIVQYNFLAEGVPQPVVSLTMDSAETEITNIEYADSNYTDSTDISVRQLAHALPMSIYPNPAHTTLQVELPAANLPAQGATLTLVNALGQPVWQQQQVRAAQVAIPVAELPRGAYVLTMTTRAEGRTLLRAVKQVVLQ